MSKDIEIPEGFSGMNEEDYQKLAGLVEVHISQLQRGIPGVIIDTISGKNKESQKRLDDIARLAKLPDSGAVQKLIANATLHCIASSSSSREEVMEKIKASYGAEEYNDDPLMQRFNAFSGLWVDRLQQAKKAKEGGQSR